MRFSRTNMLISSWPAAAFVKENRRQTAEFSITDFCWRNAGLKKSRTYTRHDAEIRPELFNLSVGTFTRASQLLDGATTAQTVALAPKGGGAHGASVWGVLGRLSY